MPLSSLELESCVALISQSTYAPAGKIADLRSRGLDMFLSVMGIKGRPLHDSPKQPFGIVSGPSIGTDLVNRVENFAKSGGTVLVDGSYMTGQQQEILTLMANQVEGASLIHSNADPVALLSTDEELELPLDWVVTLGEGQRGTERPLVRLSRRLQYQNGFVRRRLGDGYILFATFCPFLNIGWALSVGRHEQWVRSYASLPVIDVLSHCIVSEITRAFGKRGVPLVRIWPWPLGKKAALGLSHDIDFLRKDLIFYLRDAWNSARRLRLRNLLYLFLQIRNQLIRGEDPYQSLEKIADLEKEVGAKSTFFLLGDRQNYPLKGSNFSLCEQDIVALVKRLRSEGFEFSLHASFHSFNNKDVMSRDGNEFSRYFLFKPKGIRQHFLNFDRPRTWLLQSELGFEYDSSLGCNRFAGFVTGTSFPFFPFGNSSDFLELALTLQDRTLLDMRFMGFSTDGCKVFIDKLVNVVCRLSGLIVVNWHNSAWDEVGYEGWSDVYKYLLRRGAAEDLWITKLQSISSWWKERNIALRECLIKVSTDGKLKTSFNDHYTNLTVCFEWPLFMHVKGGKPISRDHITSGTAEKGPILVWKPSWKGDQVIRFTIGDRR